MPVEERVRGLGRGYTVCLNPFMWGNKIIYWAAWDLLSVGSINDKDSIAQKRTYAETIANYVTPRVAPQIDIATHV